MIENILQTLTVTELNRRIRHWLETDIGLIAVQGEISNLSRPASGHAYFSLKDPSAQLRCVFFKGRHPKSVDAILQNGQALILYGTLSIYEARGDYQLIVERIETIGKGDLFQQFEALKIKLKAAGLFEAARKKRWPRFPNAVGLITSPTGAAIRDMQSTLARRFPMTKVYVYPSEVQGTQAPAQLIKAIQQANIENKCDVLLLARGGGSLEDLWAFNDEALAYAITDSNIPIISGVGHETDFTIADFVADFRAATPTAAAEAATPDQFQLAEHCHRLSLRLNIAITRLLSHQAERVHLQAARLKSPKQLLESHWQTLDYLTHQLQAHITKLLTQKKHQLSSCASTLNALSPLATLERGYAIATYQTHVIKQPKDAPLGAQIALKLAKGQITCEVKQHD